MAESKTPSTSSIETAIEKTKTEIKKAEERKKEHRQMYIQVSLQAANTGDISDEEKKNNIDKAKKYFKRYRIVENIQNNLKIQLEALQNCQSAEGEECPNVADNSNSVSEILEPTESATEQEEKMYENPDALPTIDIDELVRELSKDDEGRDDEGGGDAIQPEIPQEVELTPHEERTANYDFDADDDDELSFKQGDKIMHTKKLEGVLSEWGKGYVLKQDGSQSDETEKLFPLSYLQPPGERRDHNSNDSGAEAEGEGEAEQEQSSNADWIQKHYNILYKRAEESTSEGGGHGQSLTLWKNLQAFHVTEEINTRDQIESIKVFYNKNGKLVPKLPDGDGHLHRHKGRYNITIPKGKILFGFEFCSVCEDEHDRFSSYVKKIKVFRDQPDRFIFWHPYLDYDSEFFDSEFFENDARSRINFPNAPPAHPPETNQKERNEVDMENVKLMYSGKENHKDSLVFTWKNMVNIEKIKDFKKFKQILTDNGDINKELIYRDIDDKCESKTFKCFSGRVKSECKDQTCKIWPPPPRGEAKNNAGEAKNNAGEAKNNDVESGEATNESKKYTMPIELISKKIQIFSTPPTTETQKDRNKLWDLFTTNRESLTKEKIQGFYDKLKDIYGKYNTELKGKIVNFNPPFPPGMAAEDAARKIYTFINSDSTTQPEKEDVKQMVKDLNRSSDTFTNSLTTVIDNSKNLFENFSKPLLIIYTKFMYDVLTDEDGNIKHMPVLSTQTPEEKNKKRKEYSLLYWAQSDINIFRYVMDGLFLLYKNDEIHEPDIFDIIVTIHILYNCEYGSEFRGALNNPLPSMLAYKRVRYYCDRLYPEIFDILDMSEMIEVANIPEILAEPGQDLKTPETLKTEIEKINLDAVTTIKQCETVSCPRLPKELKEGWKRSVHPESMKLLKHHMGYFKLFKNYYWSLFHSETFGMTENYIPLMFMDYKIKITGKKKDIAQEKRIFQPGLSWFKHLLKRGSNAYYWLYTSLLIALKEEFIDKCGEITCDDQPYYGSDIMTNILNTLTCEINANGQIDTKGKNYTNITQFIPRAIEIYEEMNKNGRMDAMEKEADSKLEKGKTYTTNENGKRYYTRVPDFDDELIMKRHEIKRKLVYLLIKSGNNETSPLELYKTVFNAGLNNILIPIGVPRNQIRTIKTKIPLRKTKEKESKSTNITFCSFSESELIESYYIKKFGTSVGESELKTLKRKTKRCRKKRRVNKVSRKKYITKKLEKLKKKKTKESERITKIATQEEEDKKYKQQIKKQEKQDTSNKSVKPKKKSVKPKKKGTSTFGRTGRGRAVIEMAAAITKSLR